MLSWASDEPQGPVSIHLDPTSRCNISCVFLLQFIQGMG